VVGATLAPPDEEEEDIAEEADEDKEPEENKVGTYEVIGTLSDPASAVPDFVKEIVKVHKRNVCRVFCKFCFSGMALQM